MLKLIAGILLSFAFSFWLGYLLYYAFKPSYEIIDLCAKNIYKFNELKIK